MKSDFRKNPQTSSMVGKGYQNFGICLGTYSASSLETLYLLLRDLRVSIACMTGEREDGGQSTRARGWRLRIARHVSGVES